MPVAFLSQKRSHELGVGLVPKASLRDWNRQRWLCTISRDRAKSSHTFPIYVFVETKKGRGGGEFEKQQKILDLSESFFYELQNKYFWVTTCKTFWFRLGHTIPYPTLLSIEGNKRETERKHKWPLNHFPALSLKPGNCNFHADSVQICPNQSQRIFCLLSQSGAKAGQLVSFPHLNHKRVNPRNVF